MKPAPPVTRILICSLEGLTAEISFPGATQSPDASCARPGATTEVIGTPKDASIPEAPATGAFSGFSAVSGDALTVISPGSDRPRGGLEGSPEAPNLGRPDRFVIQRIHTPHHRLGGETIPRAGPAGRAHPGPLGRVAEQPHDRRGQGRRIVRGDHEAGAAVLVHERRPGAQL